MQNISGSGGGTSGTGGGASAGGAAGTAGGTASTGGGASAGGTAVTGGGTSGTGGGTSGTGGGTSGTGGGGTSGTGGGSANSTAFCSRLLGAQTRFFGGRPNCPGTFTISPNFNLSACTATWNVCTTTDRMYLDQIADCMERAPVCTSGNEVAASNAFVQCLSLSEALSQACAASLMAP